MDNIDNMDNSQLQLVTNEQAQRLKKLKFFWKCIMRYSDDTGRVYVSYFANHNQWDDIDLASAPTVAHALKWFRNEWHILYGIDVASTKKYIAQLRDENTIIFWAKEDCTSYEAAESALLDKLLTLPDCTALLADIEKQPET